MASEAKPRAKPGLRPSDHSKRGQRFVTVLDPVEQRVTLLVPWEHAVLVLCDGSRTDLEIAAQLESGIDGEAVTLVDVGHCLRLFAREGLLENAGRTPADELPPPGPKTLAGLQQAYREWHKDPEVSGRILSGLLSPPFLNSPPPFKPTLAPTVALPGRDDQRGRTTEPPSSPVAVGSTLVVDGPAGEGRALRSVLDTAPTASSDGALTMAGQRPEFPPVSVDDEDLTNVAELLAAVDFDLANEALSPRPTGAADGVPRPGLNERTERDLEVPEAVQRVRKPVGRAVGGMASLPAGDAPDTETLETLGEALSPADILSRRETAAGALCAEPEPPSFKHRQLSEAGLTPTLVGHAPPEGRGPPVLVAPPRDSSGPKSAGHRVLPTVGPEPSASSEDPTPDTSRAETPAD